MKFLKPLSSQKIGWRRPLARLCLALALGGALPAVANEWYVSKAEGNDATGDGSTNAPFATIQRAVDAAAADDTVWVHPGVYDTGTTNGLSWTLASYSGNSQVRVKVTKRLNIYATGNRDDTVILGNIGTTWVDPSRTIVPTYATDNIGCMLVDTAASGTVVKGITFRDGAFHQSCGNGSAAGGISCTSPRSDLDFTVIDCAFDHCYGRGAGAMHGGLAIRCIFTRNWTSYEGAAMYAGRAFNCLFTHNAIYDGNKESATLLNCIAVNCAVLESYYRCGLGHTGASAFGGEYYNTVSYGHNTSAIASTSGLRGVGNHCAADAALDEGSSDVTVVSDVTQITNACICPATGDYRPVAGGLLDGTGDAAHLLLAFIPEEERNVNFDGTARAVGDPTPIGLLLPAAEVKSGVLKLQRTTWSVNGRSTVTYPVYIQSAKWPDMVSLDKPSTAGANAFEHVYGWHTVYRGMQDTIIEMLPPKTDWDGSPYPIQYLEFAGTTQTRYVDGSYEGGDSDGTEEKPYTTIQDAINSVVNNTWTLIRVAKGVYSPDKGTNGGVDPTGHNACIYVPTGRNMVIRAVDGPEETFIEGAADPNAPSTANGCGPGAYRCAYFHANANVCMAGFTFRNGHTVTNNSTVYSNNALGGAVFSGGANAHLYDCVFTGNAGTTAVANNGLSFRCTVTNNTFYGRGLFHYNAYLSSCLIANNASASYGRTYVTLYNSCNAFNCTICEPNAYDCNTYNVNSRLVNCAIYSAGKIPQTTRCIGSVMYSTRKNYTVTDTPNLNQDPLFASKAMGDYRLAEGSPAIGYALTQDPLGSITTAVMLRYIRTDLNGNPIVEEDGRINAGCLTGVRTPQPIYVKPDGDDAADGRTEATAFGTLQAAVDLAARYNGVDDVVALPGEYSVGASLHTGKAVDYSDATATIRSRVLIPAGITLRSRDGAAVTTIRGAAATAEGNADEWGRGDDAIRCAFLESGATLKGFTLTDGHTSGNLVNYRDDTLGGAVLGRNWRTSIVEDCIVTGNHSPCGGAGSNVSFRRCKIYGNYGLHFGAVIRTGSLYDCLVYQNYGQITCDLFTDVINCTFYDNYGPDLVNRTQLFMNGGYGRVINTLAMDVSPSVQKAVSVVTWSNCVFSAGFSIENRNESYPFENITTNIANADLVAQFSGGYPLSCTAPTVDAGCAVDSSDGMAYDGTVRVKNGTIDIGCYEYDWIGDYGAALGRNVTVTEYTTNSVVETAGKVTLTDGAVLTADWAAAGRHSIAASLAGTGTLSVYLDGTLLGTLSASGELSFVDRTGPNTLTFRYSGEGSVTALSLQRLTGTSLVFR